jgi:hypothetical protein
MMTDQYTICEIDPTGLPDAAWPPMSYWGPSNSPNDPRLEPICGRQPPVTIQIPLHSNANSAANHLQQRNATGKYGN